MIVLIEYKNGQVSFLENVSAIGDFSDIIDFEHMSQGGPEEGPSIRKEIIHNMKIYVEEKG